MSGDAVGEQEHSTRNAVIGFGVTVVGCALAAVIFDKWFMPRATPPVSGQPIWAVIVDSRWVIGAIRFVGLCGGIYVVVSIAARIRKGQWLSSVGPFKVDEAIADLKKAIKQKDEDISRLQQSNDDLEATVEGLRASLAETVAVLAGTAEDDELGGEEGPDGR